MTTEQTEEVAPKVEKLEKVENQLAKSIIPEKQEEIPI